MNEEIEITSIDGMKTETKKIIPETDIIKNDWNCYLIGNMDEFLKMLNSALYDQKRYWRLLKIKLAKRINR